MPHASPPLARALAEVGLTAEQGMLLPGLPGRELLRIDVPGRDAWRLWQHFRARFADTGFWPVLVGGHYGANFVCKQLGFSVEIGEDEPMGFEGSLPPPPPPAAVLSTAEELSFERWVAERRDPQWWSQHYLAKAEHFEREMGENSMSKLYRQFADQWRNAPPFDTPIDEHHWPPESEQLPLQDRPATIETLDEKYRRVLAESVALVFCPIKHGWQVPAYLPFDPVEDSERPPSLHVAFLRWLSEHWGAELIGIGDRTLDVLPGQRPATEREALILAKSVRTYAIEPITGDVNIKVPQWAAFLKDSPFWSFCFAD
jgi:hypothetical protein